MLSHFISPGNYCNLSACAIPSQQRCKAFGLTHYLATTDPNHISEGWLFISFPKNSKERAVEEFGRFPERNAVLGRENTVRETAHLLQL
jgi:uncharacterized protein (DUF924 family)